MPKCMPFLAQRASGGLPDEEGDFLLQIATTH